MRLTTRLSLWFFVVAMIVGAAGLAWVLRARMAKRHVETFANLTTPTLVALGQIKASALTMAATVYRAASETSEPSSVESSSSSPELSLEDQLLQARAQAEEWLKLYQGVSRQAAVHSLDPRMLQAVGAIAELGGRFLRLQSQGAPSDDTRKVLRALGDVERKFRRAIDRSIETELGVLKQQRTVVSRAVDSAVTFSLLTALAMALLAVLLGAFMADTIARPVVRLARDARVVGSGQLSHRTAVRSDDEIGELAAAFNRMTEDLERTTVSKRYVDNIITSMTDALIVTTPEGVVRSVNRSAITLTGAVEARLLHRPLRSLFAADAPAPFPDEPGGLRQAVSRGGITNVEARCVTESGGMVPVLFSASAMRDERNELTGIVCVASDITERKRAEHALQQAQQQLIQSEKLAALGRFSAGVAHEVKNPLAILLGGIEFLRIKLVQADAELQESLGLMEQSVQRADTIVRDLLKFARPSPLQKERMPLEELVDATIALLGYGGALKQVTVETKMAGHATMVEVDRNQMQQVLLNLMMNALEAMPSGGRLSVATSMAAGADGSAGVVTIADTGEGMSAEHLAKLFEPFFTTKRDQKGTGLGLSVSKTIVELHGGTIRFESQLGQGTVVTVALPATSGGQRA